jgi:hypothetical protein
MLAGVVLLGLFASLQPLAATGRNIVDPLRQLSSSNRHAAQCAAAVSAVASCCVQASGCEPGLACD